MYEATSSPHGVKVLTCSPVIYFLLLCLAHGDISREMRKIPARQISGTSSTRTRKEGFYLFLLPLRCHSGDSGKVLKCCKDRLYSVCRIGLIRYKKKQATGARTPHLAKEIKRDKNRAFPINQQAPTLFNVSICRMLL